MSSFILCVAAVACVLLAAIAFGYRHGYLTATRIAAVLYAMLCVVVMLWIEACRSTVQADFRPVAIAVESGEDPVRVAVDCGVAMMRSVAVPSQIALSASLAFAAWVWIRNERPRDIGR